MQVVFIALAAAVGFIIAYHTYGRWLGSRIFALSANAVCPSTRLNDGNDYVPTKKAIVFGHHFTSIAGTGPIVGPAIAVMWGWLPALLWVIFGSIFIGAVHDFGALVVSLRNNGQTVGDIAGRVLNKRVRILFLLILFMALTIVLAIFGLVISAVFRQYPASIFPCTVQIPIAIGIGYWLHRKGASLLLPSIIALSIMYITVIFGNDGWLGDVNTWMASWPTIVWVLVLLVYSYVASVLPVWTLLQPRDYINSLQLLTALGLIVIGLIAAAIFGGAPPVEGAERQPLAIVAPMVNWHPEGAPMIFPFLFITIACGAVSGFHCLVSSGTSSKQLEHEPDARFVGYGSMLTEGFLATLVILACVAGLGLGVNQKGDGVWTELTNGRVFGLHSSFVDSAGEKWNVEVSSTMNGDADTERMSFGETWDLIDESRPTSLVIARSETFRLPRFELQLGQLNSGVSAFEDQGFLIKGNVLTYRDIQTALIGQSAFNTRYSSWGAAGSLGAKVGAFVEGSANFLKALGIPAGVAIALMGVLVASFAGTTLDTACRLQRYVVQELAATFVPRISKSACAACGYDLSFAKASACPECGMSADESARLHKTKPIILNAAKWNPLVWLTNKHGATIFAVVLAVIVAALPPAAVSPGFWSTFGSDGFDGAGQWLSMNAGKGGLILWPLFGATNQLLAGLAFLVIAFYLRRRDKPLWFLILPMLFMLVMPMWALVWQLFVGGEDGSGRWFNPPNGNTNWVLVLVGLATIALEIWMIVEALRLFPRIRAVVEDGALDAVRGEPQARVN